MKIVISCSGSKNGENLIYKNNEIIFVSSPDKDSKNHFRPDDKIPNEDRTWRDYVISSQDSDNLLEAYKLYKHKIYNLLYEKYGSDLYILSAGWGIINSEFKIPKYNITFSKKVEKISRREWDDNFFKDFNHLKGKNINSNEKIIFLGGANYLKLFYNLTKDLPNQKIIFHRIFKPPQFFKDEDKFKFIKCEIKAKTNWHYVCAEKLLTNTMEFYDGIIKS